MGLSQFEPAEGNRLAAARGFRGMGTWRRALLLAVALAVGGLGSAQNYVELILDASGSMYNRLADGRYRIEAAKQVLVSLITGLPVDADLHVGLRVYGARLQATEDDACLDSHLEVPIQGVDRAALRATVEGTLARGATPIALSLQLAAHDFPSDGVRRVILVTDGLESCGGDLAAMAQLYAELGIDLKIIGFDLSADAAAAFAAVADFENALSAEELAGALYEVLADVASAEAVPVAVTAHINRAGAPTSEGVSVAFVDGVTGVRTPFVTQELGVFTASLLPGAYIAVLVDAFADGRTVEIGGLGVDPGAEASFAFDLSPQTVVSLEVERAETHAGSRVLVHYQGAPERTLGLVAIAPVDEPDVVRLYQAYVSTGSGSVALLTPDVAGAFEARFYLALPEGGHQVIGRSEPFVTVAATASLEAPPQVAAGTLFEVLWQGPGGQGDLLVMVAVDDADGAGGFDPSLSRRLFGPRISMRAPDAPGHYELRYLTGQSQNVLTAMAVEVVEAVVSLSGPAEVAASSIFDVLVSGAVGPQDAIVVVRAGAPELGAETFGPARRVYGTRVQVRAPEQPGAYEIRYLAGRGGQLVVSLPLTVR